MRRAFAQAHRLRQQLTLAAWVAVLLVGTGQAKAQNRPLENGQSPQQSPRPAAAPADDGKAGPNLRDLDRKRAAATAVLMLCGVLFIGVMLLVLIILWGFRVRRIARRPLPERSPIDPLWYLRAREITTAGSKHRSPRPGNSGTQPGEHEPQSESDDDTDPEIGGNGS